jgi:hypothetical protein
VTGFWAGGRTGIFRESNPPPDGDRPNYTGVARAASGAEAAIGGYDGYAPLVRAAITAFQTGVVPVEVSRGGCVGAAGGHRIARDHQSWLGFHSLSTRPLRKGELMRAADRPIDQSQSDETLEILAFMEAADLSAERGGASVTLAEVMQAAAAAAPPSPSG